MMTSYICSNIGYFCLWCHEETLMSARGLRPLPMPQFGRTVFCLQWNFTRCVKLCTRSVKITINNIWNYVLNTSNIIYNYVLQLRSKSGFADYNAENDPRMCINFHKCLRMICKCSKTYAHGPRMSIGAEVFEHRSLCERSTNICDQPQMSAKIWEHLRVFR